MHDPATRSVFLCQSMAGFESNAFKANDEPQPTTHTICTGQAYRNVHVIRMMEALRFDVPWGGGEVGAATDSPQADSEVGLLTTAKELRIISCT